MAVKKTAGRKVKAKTAVAGKTAAGEQLTGRDGQMEDLIQVRLNRVLEVVALSAKKTLEPRGLRTTDLRILNILYDNDEVSINELARRAHVDKAWISRSVAQLLEKKWITKHPDPSDSRAQLVRLTAKSRNLLAQVRPQALLNEEFLLRGINDKVFKKSMDIMLANAEELLATLTATPAKVKKRKK